MRFRRRFTRGGSGILDAAPDRQKSLKLKWSQLLLAITDIISADVKFACF